MSSTVPRYPILLSIAAALVTMAIKFTAYWLTDSVSLFSDALESLINLVAALTALFCLWFAAQPVDSTHTYGHEKIEYFSSGLEGMLILFAAAGIAWHAITRLLQPRELEALEIGGGLSLIASLINLAVAQVLLRVGKQSRSILLEADGKHLMTDVWTSFGVIAGLALVRLTTWTILDPVIAMLVAANITWTAWDLIRRSFHGLMDHALSVAEQVLVRTAIEAQLLPGLHYHALRTRQAGARRFVDFHLLVPGDWTVQAAHDLGEKIEEAIRQVLPGAEITVHIEPVEAESSWQDSALLPVENNEKP
jgi:cation diffusion facilitator family transporter